MAAATDKMTTLINADDITALIKQIENRRQFRYIFPKALNELYLDLRETFQFSQAAKNESQVKRCLDYLKIFHEFLNFIITKNPNEEQSVYYCQQMIAQDGNIKIMGEFMLATYYWTVALQPDDMHGDIYLSKIFPLLKSSAASGLASAQISLGEWYNSQSLFDENGWYHDQEDRAIVSSDVTPLVNRFHNAIGCVQAAINQGSSKAQNILFRIALETVNRQNEFLKKQAQALAQANQTALYFKNRIGRPSNQKLLATNAASSSNVAAPSAKSTTAVTMETTDPKRRKVEKDSTFNAATASASVTAAAVAAPSSMTSGLATLAFASSLNTVAQNTTPSSTKRTSL